MPDKGGEAPYDPSIDNGFEHGVDTKSYTDVKEPRMYKVVMYNDDYTTKDFVVEVLMTIFHKTFEDATRIMIDVHKKGSGICGVFTFDIAVTKVAQVHKVAKEHGFPFHCSYEEA